MKWQSLLLILSYSELYNHEGAVRNWRGSLEDQVITVIKQHRNFSVDKRNVGKNLILDIKWWTLSSPSSSLLFAIMRWYYQWWFYENISSVQDNQQAHRNQVKSSEPLRREHHQKHCVFINSWCVHIWNAGCSFASSIRKYDRTEKHYRKIQNWNHCHGRNNYVTVGFFGAGGKTIQEG